MPFADHPDNKPCPADLSEGFTLWSLIVTYPGHTRLYARVTNPLSTQCSDNLRTRKWVRRSWLSVGH